MVGDHESKKKRFVLPDGSTINGTATQMYLRGGSIQYAIVNTRGCFNLTTFQGFGSQFLVAIGGTERFAEAQGVLECKFDATGLVGQFVGPIECQGELTLPNYHRRRY